MVLARTGHRTKGDGHAPVGIRDAFPRPLAESLRRIIPLVMAKIVVGEAIH